MNNSSCNNNSSVTWNLQTNSTSLTTNNTTANIGTNATVGTTANTTTTNTTTAINNPNNLAYSVLNIKSIYYFTLINEFHKDNRFLDVIDHRYNTRRLAQGRVNFLTRILQSGQIRNLEYHLKSISTRCSPQM
ncbi:hypothetical protein DOY81_013471 [Sarcophaga bullata]|nr:hypothetical protein DOY81_013471 [Sarcophaga bullata]